MVVVQAVVREPVGLEEVAPADREVALVGQEHRAAAMETERRVATEGGVVSEELAV